MTDQEADYFRQMRQSPMPVPDRPTAEAELLRLMTNECSDPCCSSDQACAACIRMSKSVLAWHRTQGPQVTREAVQAIREKCEQYWNEHEIGIAEMHGILEFIHHQTTALLRQPEERKRWCEHWTWSEAEQDWEMLANSKSPPRLLAAYDWDICPVRECHMPRPTP